MVLAGQRAVHFILWSIESAPSLVAWWVFTEAFS